MIGVRIRQKLQRLDMLLHNGSAGAGDGPGFQELVKSLQDSDFPRVWWENLETGQKTTSEVRAFSWIDRGARVSRRTIFDSFPNLRGYI